MLVEDKYVLNSGKPTAIQMADVLLFEAADKCIDVTYWDAAARKYSTEIVDWSLRKILNAHDDEFISVFRNTAVRKSSIRELHHAEEGGWYIEFQGNDQVPWYSRVSRRQKPTINRLLKARNASPSA